jgi:hypothetical protein
MPRGFGRPGASHRRGDIVGRDLRAPSRPPESDENEASEERNDQKGCVQHPRALSQWCLHKTLPL